MELDDEVIIPVDLGQWVPVTQLGEWVTETVATWPWNSPRITKLLASHPGFEPHAMLCTISLAYLTGVFGADDVVRVCSEDKSFRPVRPKLRPEPKEVTLFRRANRALIHEVLAQVLTRALKTQFIEGEEIQRFPPGLRRLIVENAGQRLDYARHMDRTGEP